MMWGWMFVWMVLFWAAVIGGGIWLVRSWTRHKDGSDALNTLRGRLARGEIDVQEFQQREAALRRGDDSAVRRPLVAVLVAVTLLIAIPAVIVAANGWDMGMWDMDMWDMHGRGQNTAGDPVVRAGNEASVRIEDFAFEPGNFEVPVGASVTWTNTDSAPHDATARNGDWKTSRLSDDESDTLTFGSAGTYDYYCSIHPSMKARLVVR